MVDVLKLSGNYGFKSVNVKGNDADVIDASGASWILANIGATINRYPFQVISNAPDVRIIGGTIEGRVSQVLDWRDAYENSAAVRVVDTRSAIIEDWRITNAWDGIRLNGNATGFIVENVWMSGIRDDAIENDGGMSGTIRDSLFDGVFVGLSMATRGGANRSNEVVTIDNVLIGMETYLYDGSETHMSPFKIYTNSPKMKIYNTVIAIEDVRHHGMSSLERAWDKVIDASGNYYLNLSDTPLPKSYAMPPEGFTVLQGKAARAFWETARKEWIADQGTVAAPKPPASKPLAPKPPVPKVDDAAITIGIFDTTSDKRIAFLEDGDVFRLKDLPGKNLTFVAEVVKGGALDGDVGSLRFALTGAASHSAVESVAPYALFGDKRGDLQGGIPLKVGTYAFDVDVYSGSSGRGILLDTVEFNFRVVNDALL